VNGIPIYDNHVHMDPRGRNIEAVKEFEAAGGTGFTLVNLPYSDVVISNGPDFLEQYEITMRQGSKVLEATNLKVNIAAGPYPVLLTGLAERFGLERAEEIMKEGMDIAASLVSEGKTQAIGEIGMPHFPVSREIADASERILGYGMSKARECSCPVIVHCGSEDGMMERLARIADEAGIERKMVVKHLSPPLVTEGENHGIMPSVAASRSAIREALRKGDRFMLETDYIDSPERPNVVMPVTTVTERIKGMLSSGEMNPEIVWKICGDIPDALYGRR